MARSIIADLNYLDFKIHEPIDINEALRNRELSVKLRELTLYRGSGMNSALDLYSVESLKRNVNAKVVMASSCDKYIGWNLVTFESDNFCFNPKTKGNACSHTFVLRDFRKCGVGNALVTKAVEVSQPNFLRVYEDSSDMDWFLEIKAKHPTIKSVWEVNY